MHDGFLDQWLICGPFYSDRGWATLDEDYLYGESTVRPREGVRSFGKAWRPWDTEDGFLQFLNAPFAHTLFVTGYAHSYVHVPETVNAQSLCGSDDGIKVWLNGNVVWRKDANRAAVAGEDRASIILQAGWNSLLVKVRQGMSHWQFVLQLVGENGREIGGLTSAREGAMTAKPAAHALNVRPRFTSETYEISGGVLTRTVSFEVGNPGTERIEQAEVRVEEHHTPEECGRIAVRSLKLPRRAVFRLVGLYDRARFSEHQIRESHKSAALSEARLIIVAAREHMAARAQATAEAELKEAPSIVASGPERA